MRFRISKKAKILFVISTATLSGAEKQLYYIITKINKDLFNPYVCCLEGEGNFTEAVASANIPLEVIYRKKSNDINRLLKLIIFLKKNKFDIVQSFCWSANNYVRLASLFAKIPILVSGERGRDFSKRSFSHWIDRILAKQSNKIICNSNIQRDKLLKTEKIQRSKIDVIYNGVDSEKISDIIPLNIYYEFNVPKCNKVICTVNNFTKHKNPIMFINLAQRMSKYLQNISFLYVGSGQYKSKYKNIIKKKKLDNIVVFTGYRNDVESILPSCDVFVLTSSKEGMPNVILEAMAAKVPVIATAVDGCKEIIKHGKNGFLVNVNDIDKMEKIILNLFNNKTLCNNITSEAWQTIQNSFKVTQMVKMYEKEYLKMLNLADA